MRSRAPSGFTLIEMLTVISIIGILAALTLPAVMRARATSRRMLCANNMRNVGIALIEVAEASGHYPACTNHGVNWSGKYHSWVVNLLPRLERNDIYSQWDFTKRSTHKDNKALATNDLSILICPDDPTIYPGLGNLSYVVNCGFGWTAEDELAIAWNGKDTLDRGRKWFDINGNGVVGPTDPQTMSAAISSDQGMLFELGVFLPQHWPTGVGNMKAHAPSHLVDGKSQTILLSENVAAGYSPRGETNWAKSDTKRTTFLISAYVCLNLECSQGNVDYSRANDHSDPIYRGEAINASLQQEEAESPFPSSYHVGQGVHVFFADGHIQFLDEGVDGMVYASLCSPQGSLVRGPLKQELLSDDQY